MNVSSRECCGKAEAPGGAGDDLHALLSSGGHSHARSILSDPAGGALLAADPPLLQASHPAG